MTTAPIDQITDEVDDFEAQLRSSLDAPATEPRDTKKGGGDDGADAAVDVGPATAADPGDGRVGQDHASPASERTPADEGQGDEESTAVAASDGPAPTSPPASGAGGEPHLAAGAGVTFAEISIDRIVPSPHNPRRTIGDVSELAQSIATVGILEPLLVEEIADGGEYDFHVIAGERRWTAARQAGLDTVPCLVRPALEDAARLELMIIENLQREDLSPLDEAEGFRKLTQLGMSQRAIAERIRCNQSHVSKRIALTLLPPTAKAELDAGGITIEEATFLARLHREPERIEKLLKSSNRRYAIEREAREFEADQREKRVRGELEKAGVPIVDRWNHSSRISTYGVDVDVEAHKAEPCRAVAMEYGEVIELCTEPKRHNPRGASELKVKPKPKPKKSNDDWEARQRAEEEAREARLAEIAAEVAPRRAFVKGLIARPKAEAVHRLALVAVIGLEDWYFAAGELRVVIELADGDVPEKIGQTAIDDWLGAAVEGDGRNLLRNLYLAVVALAEVVITPDEYDGDNQLWGGQKIFAKAYLEHLEAEGYQLTDGERAVLQAATAE